MKRLLLFGLVLVVTIPLLLWAGLRVWIQRQPDELRASIESFDTLTFLGVLRDHFQPPPVVDHGRAGRRAYPGRGHSPWVLRLALDGRPRVLSAGLAPDVWLAYSTETAGIHRFWRGGIAFGGPVYDHRHGAEPRSRGPAWWAPPRQTPWRVRDDAGWQPARIQWRGHGFEPESGALWLRFELRDASGRGRTVTEWPEATTEGAFALAGRERTDEPVAIGLERRFALGPGPAIALALGPEAGMLQLAEGTEARREAGGEGGSEDARIVFPARATGSLSLHLVHGFDAPGVETPAGQPELADGSPEEADPFAVHDCLGCHNARERVVGPAWSEIALRHREAPRAETVALLARRVIEGSVGQWGRVAMTPHVDLPETEALALVERILDAEPGEALISAAADLAPDDEGEPVWTFGSPTERPPDRLHPALSSTPIDPPGFTPRVGGLAWLPDGRLGVATWDRDGAVFAVDGWRGTGEPVTARRIAEGLHEPLGLAVVDDAIYVMQKQELTRLVDHDGDGWTDEYRTLSNDWQASSNFHEFGFGLAVIGRDLYAALGICVLNGGKSCPRQSPDRGRVLRVSVDTGERHFVARGLRTPNGLAVTPAGELLVTDNQGDWLPASKLIRVRPGAHYGWRAPNESAPLGPVDPPALWLPQNEVGNSPTQPVVLTHGPYAGHVLFGDIFNGGLKRAFLEEVGGTLQGAAFHFSGGLEGPVNRLLLGPGGELVAGQVGSRGNWGEPGKDEYGLETLRFGDEPAFEPLAVRAVPGGFAVELGQPLARAPAIGPEHVQVVDWRYMPSPVYGGPKYHLRSLAVERVETSADRRVLRLAVPGLAAGRVVYLRLDRSLRSERGEPLWVNEAWYTLNALPTATTAPPAIASRPPNTLAPDERAKGWRLLFDGRSFAGWKTYGNADDDPIEGWTIDDGALHLTRDVSFARLVWNHLTPWNRAALDLMTRERFGDFELALEWRISPGGNSGVFYAVPDESTPLAWELGLEMQVLDDAEHADGRRPRRRAGDLYDLQSLARGAARPAGEWNRARIRIEGRRVRHWLGDVLVVDLVRGSPEWARALDESKFADVPGFGLAERGHVVLQDHGDPVWYRSIRIRELDAPDAAAAP